VEAGKKAAAAVLGLQARVQKALSNTPQTAEQIAAGIGAAESTESVYLILEHLAANRSAKIATGEDPGKAAFTHA
jgi:glucose-6-phosphate isomerase